MCDRMKIAFHYFEIVSHLVLQHFWLVPAAPHYYRNGFKFTGRKDLNRNFPKWHEHKTWEMSDRDDSVIFSNREQETQRLMRWILDNVFVLSANFHDGAVLVNYPWDNYQGETEAQSGVHRTPGKMPLPFFYFKCCQIARQVPLFRP